jgi:hypothetical protein
MPVFVATYFYQKCVLFVRRSPVSKEVTVVTDEVELAIFDGGDVYLALSQAEESV